MSNSATEEYCRGLAEGAKTMRDACSAMLRLVANEARAAGGLKGVLHTMAAEYATSINSLPLPSVPKTPAEWSPAPGVHGTVLYQADGMLVGRVTLEPGADVPEEQHAEVETVVEVRGNIVVLIDGATWARLRTVPSGMKHTICNASATEHAEYIAVIRRA